jgi:hypothetical protein
MLSVGQNHQKLEKPESLDVLIVSRRIMGLGGLVWQYQLWTIDEGSHPWDKPYSSLYGPAGMKLYSGQRATVIGDQISKPTPIDDHTNLVLCDVQNPSFELYVGQNIHLANPVKSDRENATYAGKLMVEVNGRLVRFDMPIIMNGATIEDFNAEPLAVIKKIIEPYKHRDNAYFLVADFVNPDVVD